VSAHPNDGATPNEWSGDRHSTAYADWLTDHPGGYVLKLSTVTIHKANCSSVRALITPAHRPGSSPDVFCGRSIAPLEYAMLQFEGAVHLCARCQPSSDPSGLGQLAQYAANMRAKIGRDRAAGTLPGPDA
jgi:hypothetical protein